MACARLTTGRNERFIFHRPHGAGSRREIGSTRSLSAHAGGVLLSVSTIRKQHRFATIPEELIFDSSISCGARTLYAILDRHADRDGEAYPGMRRICMMLGVSIDTARGYRAELEASGWLLNQGQNRSDGLMTTNRYLLMQIREGARNLVPENTVTEDYRTGTSPVRENPVPNDSTFSNESPLGNERLSAVADAPRKPKLRNLSWEALARIGKHDPSKQPTKFFSGMVGTCLKQLREAEPDLDDDDLALEIQRRASAYRAEWGDQRLTPGALVKHWSRFRASGVQSNQGDDGPTMIFQADPSERTTPEDAEAKRKRFGAILKRVGLNLPSCQ